MCEGWLVKGRGVEEGEGGGVEEGRRDEDYVRCVLMTLRILVRDEIYQVREILDFAPILQYYVSSTDFTWERHDFNDSSRKGTFDK